jgi:alpha-glucosidase
MKMRARSLIGGPPLLALLPVAAAAQEPLVVASPDGRNEVRIELGGGGVSYAVSRGGKPVIEASPIGLVTDKGSFGSEPVTALSSEQTSVNEVYRPVAGKASKVPDSYSQLVLHLQRANGHRFDLVARAYDDGVALRLVVPQQEGLSALDVQGESTTFNFAADYGCWGFNVGKFVSSHEGEFDPVRASRIRDHNLFDAPLVCETGNGTTFAITEADKRDYAGAYYAARGDGGLGVRVVLTPRTDNSPDSATPAVSVRKSFASGPLETTWRVVMLGDRPGDLVESSLVGLLAEPSKVEDTSWIKPGKSAWDWWNGWAVNIPDAGINTATYKAYIDLADRLDLEYVLIDAGWYKGSSFMATPADVTVPVPEMNIPELVRYADERGVGVWVWAQWKQLERQLDDALALYSAWGIKGVKVDFMDRTDQDMVEYYHRLMSTAAKNRLMINLHGAYPPDGLNRTYPNFVTQEGVLGAEYNKWSARVTATHNVTLPFTRMLLGPIDYTPGGFRSVSPADFPRYRSDFKPFVKTTRAHGLAMYVVYDTPLAMVADSPDVYVNADGSLTPGTDFIQRVPTTWDETRVVAGEIGQYIVTARRKGETWYIGAMTNEAARKVAVSLDFLDAGRAYAAEVQEDGAGPNDLRKRSVAVRSGGKLALTLAGSGGAVAVIEPAAR